MWEHTLVTTADVSAERLWEVIADVPNWPTWQRDVEFAGPTAVGVGPILVRANGALARQMVEEFSPPTRFACLSRRPLARIRTVHEFEPDGRETRVRVTLQVFGPLGFLYRRLAGEEQADRLAEQTRRLIGRARQTARKDVPRGRADGLFPRPPWLARIGVSARYTE
jgi:hypothetical protein